MRRRGLLTAVRIIVVGLPLPLRARQLPRIRFRVTRRSLGYISCVFVAAAMFVICLGALPAAAQKHGGTLRVYMSANPSSLSILEEVSFTTVMAAAPIFNGLVVFDPMKPIGGIDTVIPDLAESLSWDESGTKLTFKLRQGVKWHDGKPFTAKDVQCTWHWLSGKNDDYFRKNPRRVWWTNLREVTVGGDHEATFHFARPQPSVLALLASGFGVVYPCHVAAKDQRTNPIGTGPSSSSSSRATRRCACFATPTTGRRASPTSTQSTTRSLVIARRACSASSPARST